MRQRKKSNLNFYTSLVSRAKTLQNKQYIYTTITLQTRNLKRQMPNFIRPGSKTPYLDTIEPYHDVVRSKIPQNGLNQEH